MGEDHNKMDAEYTACNTWKVMVAIKNEFIEGCTATVTYQLRITTIEATMPCACNRIVHVIRIVLNRKPNDRALYEDTRFTRGRVICAKIR